MMDVTNEGKIDYNTVIQKMEEKRGAENVKYVYPNAKITGKLGTYNYIVSETEIRIGSSKSDVVTYSFTVGDLLAKVNDETITLDDLKELCNDEGLEINKYLITIDGSNLCYISSDDSKLCSIEPYVDKLKNNKLNRYKYNDTYHKRRRTIV